MKKHITVKLKPRQCTESMNGYYPTIYYADGAKPKLQTPHRLRRARQLAARRVGQQWFAFYRWAR